MWDPEQYRRFAAERARPFAELVALRHVRSARFCPSAACSPWPTAPAPRPLSVERRRPSARAINLLSELIW
jgi:trans-aconitate methyltransferase